jgi:hypothetical protein
MKNTPHIFRRLERAAVVDAPFPHLILEDALDADFCRALVREVPPLAALTKGAAPGSNQRFTLSSGDVLADRDISETWKEVVREGLSQPFLDCVIRLFTPHVRREFPDFAGRFGQVETLRAVSRQAGRVPRGGVGLDAQIAVNTPALEAETTVRGPHLDRTDKLFVGLLYLRPDDDRSTGADLEFYEPLEASPVYDAKRSLTRDRVRLVRTVPYRSNTLVLFLNTPRSLHGVSPRAQTEHPRYFLNLVGTVSQPLYRVNERRTPRSLGARLKQSLRWGAS